MSDFNMMVSYLQFYLDLLATPENVSLLYHLANKGKTVRDAESHAYSVVLHFIVYSSPSSHINLTCRTSM